MQKPSATNLVHGVTAENYRDLGKAFIGMQGHGFLIALRKGKTQGVEYEQSLRQWGAWLVYFHDKGIKTTFMQSREFYTVPAEWPHLFDGDATVQGDMVAGEEFERHIHRKWATEKIEHGSAAQRAATIAAYRLRMAERKPKPTPEEFMTIAPEIRPPVDISDFPDRR